MTSRFNLPAYLARIGLGEALAANAEGPVDGPGFTKLPPPEGEGFAAP